MIRCQSTTPNFLKRVQDSKRKNQVQTFTAMTMPGAWFAGLRMDEIDDKICTTSLPGGWRTQNPFKTMYWAVQGMGAELATGAVPFAISRSMSEKLRMFVSWDRCEIR